MNEKKKGNSAKFFNMDRQNMSIWVKKQKIATNNLNWVCSSAEKE